MSNPTINGYLDLRLIGRGGSASVYRARQQQLERDVAIKVLRASSVDARTKKLFDSERRLLGQLPKHQNIVTVFDSGFTNQGDPFLAMELCASGSLADALRIAVTLPLEQCVRIGLRMAMALDFAHRRAMIHRDVKPENVLISDVGEPVLSDFGIASLLDQQGNNTDQAFSPHHVAPEILRGMTPATTADIYSLGSTLFTLLCGRAPHQRVVGERPPISQVLTRVSDPYYPIDLPDDTQAPRELRQLLRAMLVKDPTRRVAQASQVVDALRRIEAELGMVGREFPLPTSDGTTLVQDTTHSLRPAEPFASDDPDATFVGDPAAAARRRTVEPDQPKPTPAHSYVDETFIAPRASNTPLVPEVVGIDDPGSPDQSIGPVAGSKPKRSSLFISACIVSGLIFTGLVAYFLTRPSGSSPGNQPQVTVAAASVNDTAPVANAIGLTAPSDVQISDLTTDSFQVSWVGDIDPAIRYEISVLRGSVAVSTVEVSRSPATISGIDMDGWTPCVVVSGIDTGTGTVAASDPTCANGANP